MGYVKAILLSFVNAEGKQQVVIEYRHPGKPSRLRFPTNFRVSKNDWIKDLGISKTDESLNAYLKAESDRLEKVKKSLLENGIEPTCVEMQKALEIEKERAEKVKRSTNDEESFFDQKLIDWCDIHLNNISNKNTRKSEKNVRNYVELYDKNAKLKDIDFEWLEGFYDYISKHLDKISTIESYMSRLGRVFNTIKKYNRRNRKIKQYVMEIKEDIQDLKPDVLFDDPIGLDYGMFLDLFNFDQFDIKQSHLRVTRDHFVLMVSMGGLRVHDYLAIKQDDIRKEYMMIDGEAREVWLLNYFEQKNKKQHKDIPILSYGVEILKRNDGKLPKRKPAKDINLQLKKLAELLGWDHEIEVKYFDADRNIKMIERKRFCDHITSKMARQTRVSIDDESQIDEAISRLATGHRSKARSRYQYKSTAAMVKGNLKHEEIYNSIKKAE
ncbi:phage integrase SAM-like domain-containing protein [Catalinimonas sp. 4WD22]|uniref:phage integrase SAM-like domain-containing protein n=1 Tax=Catalinimonas locisalis TaxID=3133978 RepID=UPI003101AAAC